MLQLQTNQQFTCNKVCIQTNIIFLQDVFKLKPIGNLTSKPNIDVTFDKIIESNLPHVKGGQWMYKLNSSCENLVESGVAIVIVCYKRWMQLSVTLSTLIPLLQKQHLCYRIFVLEQYEEKLFNKAKLMNVGFVEAFKLFKFECIVFQDADLVPLNDLIPYGCDEETKHFVMHLGVGLDNRNYKLHYNSLIGGVLKISNEHFIKANGFSNLFYGWGQEDDDFERRLKHVGINYHHLNVSVSRYMHVPHSTSSRHNVRSHLNLLRTSIKRMDIDGLNSLSYKLIEINEKPLFTHIIASIE